MGDPEAPRPDDVGGEYQAVMQRYVWLLREAAGAAEKLRGGQQMRGAAQETEEDLARQVSTLLWAVGSALREDCKHRKHWKGVMLPTCVSTRGGSEV